MRRETPPQKYLFGTTVGYGNKYLGISIPVMACISAPVSKSIHFLPCPAEVCSTGG